MPETRVERLVFVVGLAAIAGLVFLIVHLRHHTPGVADATPAPAVTAPARTSSTTPPVTTRARASAQTRTTTGATATTAPVPRAVSLALTAKTDTWFEVRSGSARGSLLYDGILRAGSTKVFQARSLWARFGSAANLSARLDRKKFRLPAGTYSATFDGHGFRRLG